MIRHVSYDIADGDNFNEAKYPEVVHEVEELSRHFSLVPGNHKSDIVISYLKDHCIKTEYLLTNKRVVEKIVFGAVGTFYTEALFSSSRGHSLFVEDLEDFIKTNFS
jgi:hypothetical protein